MDTCGVSFQLVAASGNVVDFEASCLTVTLVSYTPLSLRTLTHGSFAISPIVWASVAASARRETTAIT